MVESIIYLGITFVITAILGKYIIPMLKKLKVGQSERLDGPRSHLRKQGTPTMGGIIMIIALIIIVGISGFVNLEKAKIIIPIALATIGFGLVGFIDDYKKVVLKNTDGLNPKLKMLGLLVVATIYTVFLQNYGNLNNEIFIPIIKQYISLPVFIYIPFIILVMLATTNAINLTDGVDGLCGSVVAIISTAFSIICLKLGCPEVSIFSAIIAGTCLGFLIYNFHKAKVFMGDTGSLLLGGALSSVAIYVKMPLLLLVMAIVSVIETLSVILQVWSGKYRGKRIFKMTPLHHHFELSGWRENKIVVVWSVITLVASVLGILMI